MEFKSIAVFCGSKTGCNQLYTAHATALASMFAEKNIILIYGGGYKGIIGAVANAVHKKRTGYRNYTAGIFFMRQFG